jgi:hypothetical protein
MIISSSLWATARTEAQANRHRSAKNLNFIRRVIFLDFSLAKERQQRQSFLASLAKKRLKMAKT